MDAMETAASFVTQLSKSVSVFTLAMLSHVWPSGVKQSPTPSALLSYAQSLVGHKQSTRAISYVLVLVDVPKLSVVPERLGTHTSESVGAQEAPEASAQFSQLLSHIHVATTPV